MLPNFLIIGAMKAGTTSLYNYLHQHPQIFMPSEKEIHFFNRDENWNRGIAWYEGYFQESDGAMAVGEASPGYTMFPHSPDVPGRIATLIPDARLVYLIRHPIERMRSHYAHRLAYGHETRPIREALLENPLYANMSRYWRQIEQYLGYFEPQQLLAITSEELRRARAETLRQVYDFLGVSAEVGTTELEHEFHRTSQMRVWRSVPRAILRVPGASAAARFISQPLKNRLYERMTSPAVPREQLEISDDLRVRLEDMVRDDVRLLRTFLAPEFSGWGIV